MRSRGFTLLEVMVAMAILAMMSTVVWSSFRETSNTKKMVEAQALRYRTVRLALGRMARELSMAYLSQNEDTSLPERRTRFIGKINGNMHDLTFSYFGHQRLYEDAHEADTAVISYYGELDKDRHIMNLMHRESRRLGYVKPEDLAGEADIVCDDIVKMQITYYDSRDKTWREEWNTTQADGQPDRLPSKVKIVLTVRDERGQEVPFTTQQRIPMQEPLSLKAVDGTTSGTTTGGTSTSSTTGAKTTTSTATPTTTTPATTVSH